MTNTDAKSSNVLAALSAAAATSLLVWYGWTRFVGNNVEHDATPSAMAADLEGKRLTSVGSMHGALPIDLGSSSVGAVEAQPVRQEESKGEEGPRRRVERIVHEIERFRADGSFNQNHYRPLLKELGELGTEESIGVLITYMEDHDFDFPHRLSVFADALAGSDDQRIYPAARRLLEEKLELGETSWNEVDGYYKLVASKGGPDGSAFLLEQLSTGNLLQRMSVWQHVEHVADQARWREFLDVAMELSKSMPVSLDVLVAWDNKDVNAELAQMLRREDTPEGFRESVFAALGQAIRPEGLDDFASHYWSPMASSDKRLSLNGLRGLAQNNFLEKQQVLPTAQPILADALLGADPDLQFDAACVIGDYPFLGASDEILKALAQLAEDGPSASSRTKKLKYAHGRASKVYASSGH